MTSSYGIRHSGISIRISDSASGHSIVVSNFSNILRIIEAVQPFKIYSGAIPVDLTKLFINGPLSISARSFSTFFIPYDGETELLSNRKMMKTPDQIFVKAERLQPVEVHSSVSGEAAHNQIRQHLALFA